MFDKGEIVSVSKKGICKVLDIKKDAFVGCDKNRDYYILKPLNEINNMVIYLPVDSTLAMRKILNHTEANNILKTPIVDIKNCEFSQEDITKIIFGGKFDEWLHALNFLSKKKKTASKKIFMLQDQKQLDTLINLVSTELAISIECDFEEIKTKLVEKLN